ncbi:hypothetical protein FO519_003046 [Halicephalobus sp. NKZ332]|nr:hypothetical protein FO519_003046 [Halicephalobus sp. NKZ332]
MIPFKILILLCSLITPSSSQFAEIAGIVGSVLPAVLGPATSGAATAAGAAGAAGAGASGALSSIGTFYQLAQAALSLTGTGVGIVNQASESSWFPAAVEQAVKANRDFQEKLLAGGGGAPVPAPTSGLGRGLFPPPETRGGTETNIGTEYGKNFETEESSETEEELVPNNTPAPDLEKELAELEKKENLNSGSPDESKTDEFGRPLSSPEPLPTPAALHANRPRVTVEIPAQFKKSDVKDYEELFGKSWPGSDPELNFNLDSSEDNEYGVREMVPVLAKLVADLKKSNLSREEITEFIKQLQINEEPRENTTPDTPLSSHELGSGEQGVPVPEKKFGKNTLQLKRILNNIETSTAATTRIILKPVTPPGKIPPFSSTVLPNSRAIVHPRTIGPPRAIPTVVVPKPVVAGVLQQQAQPAVAPQQVRQLSAAPQQVRQPSVAPQQVYTQPQYQQQAPNYYPQHNNPQQNYAQYQQQYQDYLRRYYPAYVQPQYQQQQQPFYYPNTTPPPPRQYPVRTIAPQPPTTPSLWLAHPYGQGVLLTNQQPQYVGK